MSSLRTLATLVVASLVTGCAVGPDYARPEAPLQDRYIGQADIAQRQAAVPAELSTWWDGFNDPDLSRYVNAALAQNLDLAQAGARVAQARAGVSAATAALLPAGNVSGSATRAYQSLETPLGQVLDSTPNFDRHASVYEANLGASRELDLFGGLRRGRQAALADYQATEAGPAATRLAVAAQTADIYISVRGLQARLDVAQRQVATQQGLLSMVTLLHSKGLAAELQLQQAQGARAQAQAGVPGLEAGLVAATNALDVMLGVPPGTHRAELSAIRPIPPAPQIADSGTPGDLLRRRPDLIVAERRLAASNARIGVAMAEYYPKFSLSGLLGSATAISGANLSGVLGLRWRLFDFGRINAQIAQAKGQQAEQLAAYRLAVLRATEDVENAFTALIKREQQAAVLTQGVDALGKARGASALAYEKGTVSLIEVLNADDGLLRASDALVQARAEAARSAVATFKALGGGWQAGGADAGAIAVAADSNRRHDSN
ncbi:efflux transporter outer membrane subunit [Xanthomonas citri]|uniref:efflux transporter outer membrane subunit n=1 Tax=Xanthomonas citri TaxID=346 RepID=UPI000B5C439A|nr:efflux transporter outer membrane subunit [Xanthomonas citri]ASK99391.1 RND transporter [Xanthomonas citri pv. vignicola]